ncbi:MAG: SprT family zinc-dependent metalloprotease [Pseudomonadota bacterium]
MPKIHTQIYFKDLHIQITRKKVKYLRLTVSAPDGLVKISAPMHVNNQTIEKFISTQLKWIHKHQRRYLSQPKPPEINFETGESHFLFGQSYQLQIEEKIAVKKTYNKIQQSNFNLKMVVNSGSSKQQREKLLDEYYRTEIKKIIPELINKWEPIIGEKVSQWNVRKMKTRWGSCNINARRVWLNLELAKKPLECLEYVLVHEMVHLLERYHNQRFYQFMDQFLPDWKRIRKQLNIKN